MGVSPYGDSSGVPSSVSPHLCGKVTKADFEIINVIGHGQSGTVVHLVRSRIDGEYYAMKTIDKWSLIERQKAGDSKVVDRATRERNLHVALMAEVVSGDDPKPKSHAYFIKLYYTFQTSGHLYYITEFCPMDVFDYLSYYGPFSSRKCAHFDPNFLTAMFIAELSVAVDTIHKTGSIHRDIKIDNILISVDGHVRLSDFGSCKKLGETTDRCDSIVGFSLSIMPPEFFLVRRPSLDELCSPFSDTMTRSDPSSHEPNTYNYGTAIDWYQVGICAYQVVTGRNPFHGNPLVSVNSVLYPPEWTPEADAVISIEIKDLILALLHPDESKRINSIIEVKNRLSNLPWDRIEIMDPGTTSPFPITVEALSSHILPRMLSSGSADEFEAFDPVPLATFSYTR